MTTPSAPQHGRPDPGPAGIASKRRRLTNLAYRLLGSLADAERRWPGSSAGRPRRRRQLASSARRRVRTARRPAAAEHHAALVREFRRAWAAKDIGALVGLLDPAATA